MIIPPYCSPNESVPLTISKLAHHFPDCSHSRGAHSTHQGRVRWLRCYRQQYTDAVEDDQVDNAIRLVHCERDVVILQDESPAGIRGVEKAREVVNEESRRRFDVQREYEKRMMVVET